MTVLLLDVFSDGPIAGHLKRRSYCWVSEETVLLLGVFSGSSMIEILILGVFRASPVAGASFSDSHIAWRLQYLD